MTVNRGDARMWDKINHTAKWLERLEGETREKVDVELKRQVRALEKCLNNEMPRRTARRIIDRCSKRVAWIVAGGGRDAV